jgi:excinuclease ABC subunit C
MPVTDDFIKQLPTSPGVYLMCDIKGKVLYVGKAGNLRNRVRNYFTKSGDDRFSVQFLLAKVDSIRTILTDTEKEALILENNLIKQHNPKYNVNLRDDKSFFSIKLNVSHSYPRLSLVRTQKIKPDSQRYFGPYSSARDAKVTLKFIQKLFPLRQCTDRQLSTCKRPCLNCQMKRCLCPCTGQVSKEEYGRMVESVSLLLQGRSEDLLINLRDKMENAAVNLRFEEAARLRDQLTSIERTLESQNVSFFHLKDTDVIAVIKEEPDLYMIQVLSFRKGNLLSGESFGVINKALDLEEVLLSAIKQFYAEGVLIPKEIMISRPIEQCDLIESWLSELRGNKVTIRVPLKGRGFQLLQLALKNAHDALIREKNKSTVQEALKRIASKFNLSKVPQVIEGYDISNLSGTNPVGVKVSFRNGEPEKSAYRKFKIRGYTNQDDPGMINQTISRRIRHAEEDPLPDLFLIDGGKSQLNAAYQALSSTLGHEAPPVVAIAKARSDETEDKFFLVNRKNEVSFVKNDPALFLLMQIRDEAHRFAHNYQTNSRKNSLIRSTLDAIPGIGPTKRRNLLMAFGSIKEILEASDSALANVPGINCKDIEQIRKYFARQETELGLSYAE